MEFQVGLSYRYKYPTKKQGKTKFNSEGKMNWLLEEEFLVKEITEAYRLGLDKDKFFVKIQRNNGTTQEWILDINDFEESTITKIKAILA